MWKSAFSRVRARPYLALFAVAAGVRIAFVATLDPGSLTWPDEAVFDDIARRLAATGEYDSSPYRATPGLPAMLAAVYLLFGHSYPAARLVQALTGGLLAIAVAATGEELFDRRTGMLAGVGVAFYPPLVYLAGVFYAEHLAAVLLAATVWSLVHGERRGSPRFLALAGFLGGLLALTRPVYMVFIPVAALHAGLRAAPRRALRNGALVLGIAALTIAPWTIRNAVVFDRFLPVATGFGEHLWRGNNPLARGDADDRHMAPADDIWVERAMALGTATERREALRLGEQLAARLEARDSFERDALFRDRALAWAADHPGRFLILSGRRLLTLYSPFSRTLTANEVSSPRNRLIATLALLPILALGLPGAVIALRRNHDAWIVHAAILAPTLVYAVLAAATRFRLPFDALWILLAAVAFDGTKKPPPGGRKK
ncbi:MAG TPA: glycosyltransferase family 39 protein [Longimicrobiales bacterium]|nr:glycosyltransferase family 39 protein [Longimicrobiales bacterium]